MNSNNASLTAILAALVIVVPSCKKGECEENSDCDDGIYCNGAERCLRNRCLSSQSPPCDDNKPCSIDTCDEETRQCTHLVPDGDRDGYLLAGCLEGVGDDCNDKDPAIHPGAEELCDGVDNDCDGIPQEDKDGDGRMDPAACPDGDDCNDADPDVFPGAPEPCDGVDNNCSGGADDEADTDGDGAIDPTCGGNDCDDENPSVRPGGEEICNGRDDNCNGAADETFDCTKGKVYECYTICETIGSSECDSNCELGDCVPPDEICNGKDDDCDGQADEGLPCQAGEEVECETTCGSLGWGICTPECRIPPPEFCSVPPEICNGEDDDCDTLCDDGFPCCLRSTVACITTCGSIGSGVCEANCQMPLPRVCEPPPENCFNGVDDDCDGFIDEACE